MSQESFKHEWHLYSAFALTSVLTYLSIEIPNGVKTQALGASLSALIGALFLQSENWKNAKIEMHKWIIVFSFTLALILSGIIYWMNHPKTKQQYE